MALPDQMAPFHAPGGPVGVLFCHGFTGSPASLRGWAEQTAEAGYTVSLPVLPGHATVWQELNVTSWRDWYDAVDAEYRSLRETCDTVFVAGLSMGGSLALRLAQQARHGVLHLREPGQHPAGECHDDAGQAEDDGEGHDVADGDGERRPGHPVVDGAGHDEEPKQAHEHADHHVKAENAEEGEQPGRAR